MNGLQLDPRRFSYDTHRDNKPLSTDQIKEEIRLSRQLLDRSANRHRQVLTKKKQEDTMSFGEHQDDEHPDPYNSVHRQLKYQSSSSLKSSPAQRISFTFQSPEPKERHYVDLENTNETNHHFNLSELRKKAGVQHEDLKKTGEFYRGFQTENRNVRDVSSSPRYKLEKTFDTSPRKKHNEEECELCKQNRRDRYHIVERRSSPRKVENYSNSKRNYPGLINTRYISSATPEKDVIKDPIVIESRCKFQSEGKYCNLCEIARAHNRRLQQLNSSALQPITYHIEEHFDIVEPQTKVNKINESPFRHPSENLLRKSAYYNLQQKKSPKKKVVNPQRKACNHLKRKDPRLCYSIIEPRDSMLNLRRNARMSFSKERSKTFVESKQKVGGELPHSRTLHTYTFQTPKEKTYSSIHGYRNKSVSPQGKYANQKVNFGWVRESFEEKTENKRANIYRSKSKELQLHNKSILSNLKLYELQSEPRRWYQANRRGIEYQSQLIYSYDLIKRFMSSQEITERLQSFIANMVQPKQWLSLMVDQVYDKLKDKYRQQYS